MTEGRDDADDIFQEVWLKAIRKLDSYRHGNFGGWLVRIARNVVIDRARKRKPDLSLDMENEYGTPHRENLAGKEALPSAKIEAGELGASIAAAVAALPDAQKEVFLMRVRMDLPFKEIARIQHTSINTALARMQYALAKLRPLLSEEYAALGKA
jgi:RNA polymerase sigma-70 factor (ECF subfamily)